MAPFQSNQQFSVSTAFDEYGITWRNPLEMSCNPWEELHGVTPRKTSPNTSSRVVHGIEGSRFYAWECDLQIATKVHARGPATTEVWMSRAYEWWRKAIELWLMKLMMRMSSAQTKWLRTKSMTKAKCSRLFTMKWEPTAQAGSTFSMSPEKR